MKAVNVRPITDLKNHTKELVREVADGDPVVITQNGKPRVVMMAATEHARLQDTLAMLKVLAMGQEQLARTRKLSTTSEARARTKRALAAARRK